MPTGIYKHKPLPDETKRKISESSMGRIAPKTAFKKGHQGYWLGKKLSSKHKNKIGISGKGKLSWIKGKKWSAQMRKKFSDIKKGKMPKNCTEGWRLKGKIRRQEIYENREPTSIEKKLYEELKNRGLLFESQKLINGRFIVDAYIPSLNLVVEADGNYWHSLPRTVKKDKAENAYLKTCGYNLLRISETEINNGNFVNKLPN